MLINEEIRDKEVRLIGPDGEQLGIMPLASAQNMAMEKNLDLVKIAPQATPPVCKIMDYGKYKFEQAKREYIVEPVFKENSGDTLFSLLLNLMRLDAMG